MTIVGTLTAKSSSCIQDNIVSEDHILNHRPGSGASVARRQDYCSAPLRFRPHILKHISFDDDSLGVLELQKVLNRPTNAVEVRRAGLPSEGLEEVVVPYFDVRGNQALDARVSATEHDVLAGALEVVVHDLERAGPVESEDGLRVVADHVRLGYVGVDDRGGCAVQQDTAEQIPGRVPVNIASIEDEVSRSLGEVGLGATEGDDFAKRPDALGHGELDTHEAIAPRPRRRLDDRNDVRRDQLRHGSRERRGDPDTWSRESLVGGRRADEDPARPCLPRKGEVPTEDGAGRERDDVPGLCGIECGLEVPARLHGDGPALRAHVGRIEEDFRRQGRDRPRPWRCRRSRGSQ